MQDVYTTGFRVAQAVDACTPVATEHGCGPSMAWPLSLAVTTVWIAGAFAAPCLNNTESFNPAASILRSGGLQIELCMTKLRLASKRCLSIDHEPNQHYIRRISSYRSPPSVCPAVG